MSKLHLLKSFIKSPAHTGSIWPSSEYLADEITSSIGIESAKYISELGPGTGALTEYILKKKKRDAVFFAVELNEDLHNAIKFKFPQIRLYNDNASELCSIIKKENISHLDLVISGLPWASFPANVQQNIMGAVYSSLREGGIFTTFAYIQGMLFPSAIRYSKLLKKQFSRVETSHTIWKNIPPAFVYRCWK